MKYGVKGGLVACAALSAGCAWADFSVDLDWSVKPLKDVRTSTCGPIVGYAGCFVEIPLGEDSETYFFDTDRENTARVLKEAGAYHQRMWQANAWFMRGKPEYRKVWEEKNAKLPPNRRRPFDGSNPKAAFEFWKQNGIKLLFTLEAWNGETSKKEILEFVDWIVKNDYKGVVAGFELGNESYFNKAYPTLAPLWTDIVNEIAKRWPGVKIGITLAENFELNPDLTQVRNRMLSAGEIKRDAYFAAADFNRYSAQFTVAMSNCLDKITHVTFHAYGAETPYSCSYYGMKRFRDWCSVFPELKGKKWWLTEIRPRSDEDNRCQRIFRESLVMAHYSLMAVCQPEVDAFNHHQIGELSGGIYRSDGKTWSYQWADAGGSFSDRRAPGGRRRMEAGHMGVMYRIVAEALLDHPLVLHHGTSQATDTEDAFYTSARVMDQAYARRRALKEGKRQSGGVFGGGAPEVAGEVEWIAATDAGRSRLCLLMVNSKNAAETVTVTIPGKQFAAPAYRTLSCPEKFVDCRVIPGEAHPWRELAWEDTQSGFDVVRMEKYEGMKPAAGTLTVTIEPHTVQSVTVQLGNAPKK